MQLWGAREGGRVIVKHPIPPLTYGTNKSHVPFLPILSLTIETSVIPVACHLTSSLFHDACISVIRHRRCMLLDVAVPLHNKLVK
jgi:hypothetical protein